MGTVNQPEDLVSIVKDLQRQVRELRRSSLFNAAISSGNFEARTPEGAPIVQVGQIPYGSQTVSGMAVYRTDGTPQARFFDNAGGDGYFAFFDEQGSILLSNDTVSGQGLALPYVPMTVMPYADVVAPPTLVTSGTLTNTFRVHAQKQHPRIRCYLITQTAAGTTGEVILSQGGTQISGNLGVGDGVNVYQWIDGTVSGSHLSFTTVDVQARRVSGAGNFRLAVVWASGIQS